MKIITQENIDQIKLITAEKNWSRTGLYNEINDYILNNCPQMGIIKCKSTLNDFIDGRHGLFEPNERRVKAWLDWYNSCDEVDEIYTNAEWCKGECRDDGDNYGRE